MTYGRSNYPVRHKETQAETLYCHCGKVAFYMVPRRGASGFDGYCEEHREQANDAMREHHAIKQDMRQAWSNAAGELEQGTRARDMSRIRHEPYISTKGKNQRR